MWQSAILSKSPSQQIDFLRRSDPSVSMRIYGYIFAAWPNRTQQLKTNMLPSMDFFVTLFRWSRNNWAIDVVSDTLKARVV